MFVKGQVSPRKGVKVSEETKEKMRLAKLGKPSNYKGTKTRVEVRKKLSNSLKKYFKRVNHQYKPNEKGINHDDLRDERIKSNGGYHSIGEWDRLKAQYNWTCPSCNKTELEIVLSRDHIVPISMGGSDNIENIQPLCVKCNSRKGTRTIKY